jgi:hypothetical protein
MRIAHITTDEVNLALGIRFARSLGAEMIPYGGNRKPAGIRHDAVLCDLDRIPAHRRRSFLNEIYSRATDLPLAVYGYCLSEEEADELRFHGVAVAQRLHGALVRTLVKAVQHQLTSVPPDDAMTELTWINVNA